MPACEGIALLQTAKVHSKTTAKWFVRYVDLTSYPIVCMVFTRIRCEQVQSKCLNTKYQQHNTTCRNSQPAASECGTRPNFMIIIPSTVIASYLTSTCSHYKCYIYKKLTTSNKNGFPRVSRICALLVYSGCKAKFREWAVNKVGHL